MAPEDPVVEFYKLEYDRAATRYESIYQAIWQIFSYMTVISGAVLTFGADHLQVNLFLFLVCVPLAFWYLATFVPLNKYGSWCLDRLADIEGEINTYDKTSKAKLSHYTDFKEKSSASWWRARWVVHPSFLFILAIGVWNFGKVVSELSKGTPLILQKQTEVNLIVNAEELQRLLQKTNVKAQEPARDQPRKN